MKAQEARELGERVAELVQTGHITQAYGLLADWLAEQVVHRQRRYRTLMLRKALTYLSDEQRARATEYASR